MTSNVDIEIPTGLAVSTSEPMPSNLWKLRWKFEFHDRPTRRGIWNAGSDKVEDSAWAVNKESLAWACIDGEFRETQEEMTLVRCEGQDYAFFQWEAYSRVPAMGLAGEFRARAIIAGISLYTREDRITVWINGKWDKRPLTDDERQFQFKEHSV